MAGHRCCCGDTTPGPGPGPIVLCPEVNSCTWHPTVTELTLDIDGWHSMRVAHYNVAGVPHCETVEVEWDYTATIYRTGASPVIGGFPSGLIAWADARDLGFSGLGVCPPGPPSFGECDRDYRKVHEWVSIDCDPPFGPDYCGGQMPLYHAGANFTTYRGFPQSTENWDNLRCADSGPCCSFPEPDPQSKTISATSAPQIVGTAVRKLYNLSTNTLVTTQSVSINRNARAVIRCAFFKSSCLTGSNLTMTFFIGSSSNPAGTGGFLGSSFDSALVGSGLPSELGQHEVTFPPLPFGSFFNTYNLGFAGGADSPGEQQDGSMTLVAPISGTGFPTGFDFIERPNAGKTVCCQPFGESDCNSGTVQCTTNPSENFQRCLAPYGTSVNFWYCYRKPTVTVNVV